MEAVINLRQLRYFAKVVETGNMTRAAEVLFVAQPALGLQIRQLESELDVPLLLRHSRGVAPTTAGQWLYEQSLDILARVDQLSSGITAFAQDAQESVVLGLPPSMANVLGNTLMLEAQRLLPAVHLSVVEQMSFGLQDAIDRDDVDLALAYELPERPTISRQLLLEEDLMFVVAPACAPAHWDDDAGDTITLADAAAHPLVLASEKDPIRQLVKHAADGRGLSLTITHEASSSSITRSVVTQGMAAGIMPSGVVVSELQSGELLARRVVEPTLRRKLYLVRAVRRQPFRAEAAIMAFIERIVDQFAQRQGDLVRRIPSLP